MKRRQALGFVLGFVALVALLTMVFAAAAPAKDGDVLVRGTCTKASAAKLKLSFEDGRIEVELEVDQNRNGVRWSVTLRRVVSGGTRLLFSGSRVTRPPSGSFELRRVVTNRPGRDTIRARAVSPSGEVCRATASI
jgi:hypothetical protein